MAIQYEAGGSKKKTTNTSFVSPDEKYSKSTSAYVENPNTGRTPDYILPASSSSTPSTSRSSASDYYKELEEMIREQQRVAEQKRQAQIDAGVAELNSQKGTLATQRDDAARQAYIQLMQSRQALPQMMSAQGLGGGLSESSLMGLDTTYGNNVNALTQQYNQGVSDIDLAIGNLKTSGDLSILDSKEAYNQMLIDLANQQKQEQAALMNKYAGSGKQLTYAQALKLAQDTGFTDPTANSVLASYGVNAESLRSTQQSSLENPTVKAWIERANANLQSLAERGGQQYANNELLADSLIRAVQQGQLTREQAMAIAEKQYGFKLGI